MTLGPPLDGSGYILTVAPASSIIKRLKGEETVMRYSITLNLTVSYSAIYLNVGWMNTNQPLKLAVFKFYTKNFWGCKECKEKSLM